MTDRTGIPCTVHLMNMPIEDEKPQHDQYMGKIYVKIYNERYMVMLLVAVWLMVTSSSVANHQADKRIHLLCFLSILHKYFSDYLLLTYISSNVDWLNLICLAKHKFENYSADIYETDSNYELHKNALATNTYYKKKFFFKYYFSYIKKKPAIINLGF